MEDAEEVTVVMVVRSALPFPWPSGTAHNMTWAAYIGQEGTIRWPELVLEPDPVSGLMVSHCILQEHVFKHLLGLAMRKFALGNEGRYIGGQGMDTLIR